MYANLHIHLKDESPIFFDYGASFPESNVTQCYPEHTLGDGTLSRLTCGELCWTYVSSLTERGFYISVYYFFSSQIITSPLPPVSSPPSASKTKESSDGENLEVSTELFMFPVGGILPSKHFMLVLKILILMNN